MPFSTSNSSERVPPANYALIWLVALMVLAAVTILAEYSWRSLGHEPSITDSKLFWSMHRARVYRNGGKEKLVIVGDSRAMEGLAPSALQEVFPEYEAVHLALDGSPSYEILRDLCHDTLFTGIVIFATSALFSRAIEHGVRKDLEYSRYFQDGYHTWRSLDERINTWIGSSLQSRFSQLSSGLSVRRILMSGFRPRPLYAAMHPDRFRPAYFRSHLSPAELLAHRERRIALMRSLEGTPLSFAEFERLVRGDLREAYEVLRGRGGNLVLVQLPTTDEHWRIDSANAPQTLFWNKITLWTGIPTVHFKDYQELSEFDCPDTSHLDGEDAPEFTRRLGRIVRLLLSDGFPRRGLEASPP